MILHSLQVEGFRCFRSPTGLQELDPRLNLVVGPNESGKSTLFLALCHAFFTPYRSAGGELASLQPWETTLAPRVMVEFEDAGVRYRLEKQFLHGPACRLSEVKGDKLELLAEAEAADEKVRALLLGDKPGRGPARAEHWGLARLLWSPQGQAEAGTMSEAARDRLQAALGRMTVDAGEAELTGKIEDLYADIFTKARGDYQKGAEVRQRGDELARLTRELEALQAQHAENESRAVKYQDLQAEEQRLRQARQLKAAEAETLRADLERVRELRGNEKLASTKLQALQEKFVRVEADRTRLADARKVLAEQGEPEPPAETDDGSLRAEEQRLAAELAEVRASLDRLGALRKQAEKQQEQRGIQEALARLATPLEETERLTAERAERAGRLRDVKSPRTEDLQAARKQTDRLRELNGQLKSVGLTVDVHLEAEAEIIFEGSEGKQEQFLLAGGKQQFVSADQATIHLPGFGTLHIRSGAGEIRQLQAERQKLLTGLRDLLDRFGVTTLEELEARRQQCDSEQKELASLDEQIRLAAGKHETLAGLKQEHARLSTLLQSADQPPEVLDLDQIQRELDAEVKRVRTLEAALLQVTRAMQEASARQAQQAVARGQRESARQAAEQVRADLMRAYVDEPAVEQAYQEARREREAAQHALADLQAALPAGGDGPEARVHELQADLTRLDDEIRARHDAIVGLQALLDQSAELGLFSQIAVLKETCELAKVRHVQADRHARAVQLLRNLVQTRRQEVAANLTGPIEARVGQLLGRVTSRQDRRPVFDDRLQLQGVRVGAADTQRSIDLLSGGTQEQLSVLVRLACGLYLAESERQLVVLDDTLVYSDSARHERFQDLLLEAADRLQIVLLSCHPERYRLLAEAKVHNLGAE